MESGRMYPAKLLLFGEYTVLAGGRALAVPLDKWGGHWKSQDFQDQGLMRLCEYLDSSDAQSFMNVDAFCRDIHNGLVFESDIPMGYGVGSSAALTAAVYERYRYEHDAADLGLIKSHLAAVESHFHGQSSGIDPLVPLTDSAILFGDLACERVTIARPPGLQLFLVDSGIERVTAPLVELFRKRLATPLFEEEVVTPIKLAADAAIECLISGRTDALWGYLGVISELQLVRFREMLPSAVEEEWRRVNAGSGVRMKLCGAGGGGFFLGFARTGIELERIMTMPYQIVEL